MSRRRGQTMVEFALIAPMLFLFIFGIVDYGRYYTANAAVLQASRAGVRYAVVYPTAWSNASPAAADTIERTIQDAAGGLAVVNDDSHIAISYYDVSGGSAVKCGSYSAATGGFVALGTYSQPTCVIPGNLIQVSVTYTFVIDAPPLNALGSSLNIIQSTQLLEEQ